jgi:hypothetical protein
MGDFYDIDYRDSTNSDQKNIVYYFNDKLHHNHLKHVGIESLNLGADGAYTVKFEFDQPVSIKREYD